MECQVLNYTLPVESLRAADYWVLHPDKTLKAVPMIDGDGTFWAIRLFAEYEDGHGLQNWGYRIFLTGEVFPAGYEYVDSFDNMGATMHLYRRG